MLRKYMRAATAGIIAAVAVNSQAASAQQPVGGPPALAVEALGGTIGSALGFGSIVLLHDRTDCGENLSCTLGYGAAAVAAGTVGAAAGSYIAGRLAGTEPSALGAAIGAVAGAAASAGIDHVLSGSDDSVRYVSFALAQGILSAAGSRIGSMLR